MLWALISIGMSLVHSPCLQYAGVRFLVIINKVVSDCHVGLCSKSVCLLQVSSILYADWSASSNFPVFLVKKLCGRYSIPWLQCLQHLAETFIFGLYGPKSFQLNPAMDFFILVALGDEKGSVALNIAFTAAGWLTTLALITFSTRRSGWWRWKWLCMFVVLPVYFSFTREFLRIA